MRRVESLLAVLSILPGLALAQNGSIRGRVTDATGAPLSRATMKRQGIDVVVQSRADGGPRGSAPARHTGLEEPTRMDELPRGIQRRPITKIGGEERVRSKADLFRDPVVNRGRRLEPGRGEKRLPPR